MPINVTTEALQDIDAAVVTFASKARESLHGYCAELDQTLVAISVHERRLELGSLRVETALMEAERALQHCESSGSRDDDGNYHAPDCSGPRAEVARWRALRQQLGEELYATRALATRSADAGAAIRDRANHFADETDESVNAQRRFLAGALRDLARLHAISLPSTGVFTAGERANAARAETDLGRGNPERRG